MSDFPAHRRSSSTDGLAVFACLGIFILLFGWLLSFGMMLHGAFVKDIWEVVTGAIILAILLVIRAVLK